MPNTTPQRDALRAAFRSHRCRIRRKRAAAQGTAPFRDKPKPAFPWEFRQCQASYSRRLLIECDFTQTAAAMHQIMIALFVLLWLIRDIHVATGICIACAISGWQPAEGSRLTGWKASIHLDSAFFRQTASQNGYQKPIALNIHGEDRGEHIVLIGCNRIRNGLRSDTRPQIGGKPCHGGHPCMDGQSDRNVNIPHRNWMVLVFLYFSSMSAFSAFTTK